MLNLALINAKLSFKRKIFEDTLIALEIVRLRKRTSNISKNALKLAMSIHKNV